jgi:hypothetical protein
LQYNTNTSDNNNMSTVNTIGGPQFVRTEEVADGQIVDVHNHLVTPFAQARSEHVVTNQKYEGTLAQNSYGRQKMHDPSTLIELARHVQTADSHTKAIAGGKLDLISRQITQLQAEARQVLEDAKQDMDLAHAKCNFQRRPGSIYHLYKKNIAAPGHPEEFEKFFSMLSPAEWSGKPPQVHMGSYRLEYDMSWTPIEKIEQRDESRTFNPVLLGLTDGHVAENPDQLRLTLI